MLMYCKKCGRIVQNAQKCDICNSITYPVPEKYLLNYENTLYENCLDNDKKEQFIEECIKSSPEFDEQLFNNRDAIMAERERRYDRNEAIVNAIRQGADPRTALRNCGQNMPKCPTCGSLSIKRISGGERVASVGMFGLFSKKINKTFKCGNCGYTW